MRNLRRGAAGGRRVPPTAACRAPVVRPGPTPRRALIALCVTEIISWGVLYYAFPVMLSSVARDTGWPATTAMAAFSAGAVASALAGVVCGRLIDVYGPRPVMTTGSVTGAGAVVAIAIAPNLRAFFAAWILAGLAQSAVLYQPAFIALTGWYGPDRVRALTTLTLAAGFASAVFAPVTAVLLDHLRWRDAYLVLAGVLAVVTVPLHALCLTPPWPGRRRIARGDDRPGHRHGRPGDRDRNRPGDVAGDVAGDGAARTREVVRSGAFLVLTGAMTLAAFGCYAATINLVPLLTSRGMSNRSAAVALGVCGAGQVLGRLGYPRLAARVTPGARAVAIPAAGAATIILLGVLPGPAAALIAVAILAGAARGLFTLLQATAVADRWGTRSFGAINGVFTAPITIAIALAPGGGAVLARVTDGYPAAYSVLALVTAVAAIAAGWAER